MKRIITREDKEKKIRRNQLILGGILIVLMVLSTAGYALSGNRESEEKIKYKGIEFVKDESGYWSFNIQGYEFTTRYNPKEVEDIYFLNYLSLEDYSNKPLYFVGNSEAGFELKRNLYYFVLRMNDACLNESEDCGDLPVKNCSDNVIVIKEVDYDSGEKESITQEENCVFITASLRNQTRYVDAYLFKLLGLK